MKRKIIWAVMIALFAWLLFELDHCMSVDTCLDFNGVWDYNENRCRQDCLVMNKKYGCVQITPEFRQQMTACYEKSPKCDQEKLNNWRRELCKKYKAPINPETGFCNYE